MSDGLRPHGHGKERDMKPWRMAVLAAGVFLLGGAAGALSLRRIVPTRTARWENRALFLLHFGHGEGNARVTPEGMADFVERQLMPHFPRGFTVYDARGQWRSPEGERVEEGRLVRERTTVVAVELENTPENAQLRQNVIDAYLRRYADANVSVYVTRTALEASERHFIPAS